MSPRIDGYTLYVAPTYRGNAWANGDWLVRVYRDSDDRHIHSAEGGVSLGLGLREAERAIERDVGIEEPKP